ncbi:N-lysine methyltransferase KMT5A-B [Holothuria leucospilota]|uniref:N-lysine methyltransferase KMT5A-B n=1 Tax=Holothuria leucospilota TaxID=206669 RepID=A0A9Q1CHF7_HOLLE|nr:N-lysine methyltransferase KMT5A-B [Holothuria leucospilota]
MITRSKTPRSPSPLDWVRKGQDPPGTRVGHVSDEIGKGVFAEKNFQKGEFLFEYPGHLKSADSTSSLNEQTYIFYFMCNGSHLCIDATDSSGIGKYANDDWKDPNAVVKLVHLEKIPKLLIFARKNIITNEEIRYDYGQKMATWRLKGSESDDDMDYSPANDSCDSDASLTPDRDALAPIAEEEFVSDSEGSEKSVEFPIRRIACLSNLTLEEEEEHQEEISSDSEPDEEEIIREFNHTSVFIRKITTSSTTKTGKMKKCSRVYNSRHCCPFCKKLFTNFSQHVLGKKHEEEPAVIEIASIKVLRTDSPQEKADKEKQRKRLLTILRNRGDNEHNNNVMAKKKGEIILGRRPIEGDDGYFSIDEYGPCPMCLEWLKVQVIPRHQSTCVADKGKIHKITKGNLLIQSAVLCGRLQCGASDVMVKEVYPIMRDDEIGKVAKSDPLITALGNQWMRRNLGNKLMRKHYVSAAMRLSSRLLIQLRSMVTPPTGISMDDYLDPKFFTDVARAALKVARQDALDEENLGAPSNAIKLSFDIKRLTNIKLAKAIQDGDQNARQKAKDFLELMAIDWSTKLERITLEERKNVEKKPLPLPNDVMKLSKHLRKEALECNLKDDSYNNFRNVVIVALACLISYNRRRPGEVQAMRVKTYQARKSGADDVSSALLGELTKFEERLLMEQDVVEIRGKCGKFVPVIVPDYAKPLLEFLTNSEVRRNAGISSNNPYVFANNRSGIIRGGYAMQVQTEAAALEKPERVRATNMRRFLATMSQGLNITPQQQQWLIDHMGHTLNIHRVHYRCTSDLIERVDIAKLLILMDAGLTSRFKGKKLEDIQLEELIDGARYNDEPCDTEVAVEEEVLPDLPVQDDDDDDESTLIHQSGQRKTKKKRNVGKRHAWTESELDEVRELFSAFFKMDKTPGEGVLRKKMEVSKKKGGLIWKLPLKSIKAKISWMRLKKT